MRRPAGLFLVPNLLGGAAATEVLPAQTIEIARALRHFVAEKCEGRAAFLKNLESRRRSNRWESPSSTSTRRDSAIDALLAPRSPAATSAAVGCRLSRRGRSRRKAGGPPRISGGVRVVPSSDPRRFCSP
jgi:hypothetical protein